MADIELVIKMPEDVYKQCILANSLFEAQLVNYIANGTPLPKGHGRLVDLDRMCEEYWDGNYMEIHKDDLKNIKTIIEADKESEDEVSD